MIISLRLKSTNLGYQMDSGKPAQFGQTRGSGKVQPLRFHVCARRQGESLRQNHPRLPTLRGKRVTNVEFIIIEDCFLYDKMEHFVKRKICQICFVFNRDFR